MTISTINTSSVSSLSGITSGSVEIEAKALELKVNDEALAYANGFVKVAEDQIRLQGEVESNNVSLYDLLLKVGVIEDIHGLMKTNTKGALVPVKFETILNDNAARDPKLRELRNAFNRIKKEGADLDNSDSVRANKNAVVERLVRNWAAFVSKRYATATQKQREDARATSKLAAEKTLKDRKDAQSRVMGWVADPSKAADEARDQVLVFKGILENMNQLTNMDVLESLVQSAHERLRVVKEAAAKLEGEQKQGEQQETK